MPHRTTKAFEKAKPAATPRKVYDTAGLFLFITPDGAKSWRLRYRIAGKDSQIVLGRYPGMSLADARKERDKQRELLQDGKSPSAARKAAKVAQIEDRSNTFGAVAEAWIASRNEHWQEASEKRIKMYLAHLAPLKRVPISEITRQRAIALVCKIANGDPESANPKKRVGRYVTAQKCLRTIGAIMRHAINLDLIKSDPTPHSVVLPKRKKQAEKRAALMHVPEKNLAAEVGRVVRKIDGYQRITQRFSVTRTALLMLLHTLVRSKELRGARWDEIDFDAALWVIPKQRMKLRKSVRDDPKKPPHTVPLSTQVIALLRELHKHTGTREHLFPNTRDPKRYMSDNTLAGALRSIEIANSELLPHGFRTIGSNLLNLDAWRADVIEAALAHVVPGVRGVYLRTTFIEERRTMMQAWSDKLDALRDGATANVVPIGHAKVA